RFFVRAVESSVACGRDSVFWMLSNRRLIADAAVILTRTGFAHAEIGPAIVGFGCLISELAHSNVV
ncbi:hypothetical protein, partial [Rubinisphaera sp. JC750]|uniref:hypothetical protein n=1 Tax=Rubinisphaera sp. JC750 TaxID=2898658 RepID=UPI001F3B645A